jgi:hypothetical protein
MGSQENAQQERGRVELHREGLVGRPRKNGNVRETEGKKFPAVIVPKKLLAGLPLGREKGPSNRLAFGAATVSRMKRAIKQEFVYGTRIVSNQHVGRQFERKF